MLKTKPSVRHRVIDEILSSGLKLSLPEMINEIANRMSYTNYGKVKISERTFYYDINTMKQEPPHGFNAPIVCNNGYYQYSEKGFSINNKPLNPGDKELVSEAFSILSQFKNLPQYENLLRLSQNKDWSWITNENDNQFMIFETTQTTRGDIYLKDLVNAIKTKTNLIIKYLPFIEDNMICQKVSPALLKEYNGRWYLRVYVLGDKNYITNFALDRIISIKEDKSEYKEIPESDVHDFKNNIIGVTVFKGNKLTEVVFEIEKKRSEYLKYKELHHTQKIIEYDDIKTVFSIKVIPNYEMYNELIAYIPDIKIISPDDVKNTFLKRLKEGYDE